MIFTALFRRGAALKVSYGYVLLGGWLGYSLGTSAYSDSQGSNWMNVQTGAHATAWVITWESGFLLLCAALALVLLSTGALCVWQRMAQRPTHPVIAS